MDTKNLLKRVHVGDLEALKLYHKYYPDKHWKDICYDISGETALHLAARFGFPHIIEYLVTQYEPRCIDVRNKDNKTPLHDTAQFAQPFSARSLLELGADVNALKKGDWTPLMLACTKIRRLESLQTVRALLDYKASINHANKDGWTALHVIAREGDVDILELLLVCGVDLHKKTKNERNALHIATLHGHTQLFPLLELDVNDKDCCGNTSLHEAVLNGSLDVFEAVIKLRPDIHARNYMGYTILHLAASVGALEILEYIVTKLHHDINAVAAKNVTPLHCAARRGQLEAYSLLIELGADEERKDLRGRAAKDFLQWDT